MKKAKDKPIRIPRRVREHFPNVTEVVDSDESVEISVIQEDCSRSARRKDPKDCAMARALRRQGRADCAIVGLSVSYVIHGNKAVRYDTPASVGRELVSFDRNHDLAPGKYRLSRISPGRRLGAQ